MQFTDNDSLSRRNVDGENLFAQGDRPGYKIVSEFDNSFDIGLDTGPDYFTNFDGLESVQNMPEQQFKNELDSYSQSKSHKPPEAM